MLEKKKFAITAESVGAWSSPKQHLRVVNEVDPCNPAKHQTIATSCIIWARGALKSHQAYQRLIPSTP
jgi:hypothetical protein